MLPMRVQEASIWRRAADGLMVIVWCLSGGA